MDIRGKVAIVTGGGSGIGAAIAQRFVADGAEGVVVADLDEAKVGSVAGADSLRMLGVPCDVSCEDDLQVLVRTARERFGRIDVFVSNAGILGPMGGLEIDDGIWERMWKIHVMAHVWAARAVLPDMLSRSEGYFVVTASAAGLLNIVETAPYGVTKHAAVGLAEWLRISHGRDGIRISCLCPQSVATPMTAAGSGSAGADGVLSAGDVAEALVKTMREESFLCLPHPEVLAYLQRKTQDYDRWLSGMQKMYSRYMPSS